MDELEAIVQACEETDEELLQYESEEGIRLFFERLNTGWYVAADGTLKPPRKPLTLDQLGARIDGEECGDCARNPGLCDTHDVQRNDGEG